MIDSFSLLKYESHLLTRRVCILSAKHSQKIIVVICILLHSAIGPYHLMSFELRCQRPYSKFQVLIKKSLSDRNWREMPSVKLHVILFTWKYPSLWIESDIWFSLLRKYEEIGNRKVWMSWACLTCLEMRCHLNFVILELWKPLWGYFFKFLDGSFLSLFLL